MNRIRRSPNSLKKYLPVITVVLGVIACLGLLAVLITMLVKHDDHSQSNQNGIQYIFRNLGFGDHEHKHVEVKYDNDNEINDNTESNVITVPEYSTEKLDKLTLMDSDDMIWCLTKDMECKKLEFETCEDKHHETYQYESHCKSALEQKERELELEEDE